MNWTDPDYDGPGLVALGVWLFALALGCAVWLGVALVTGGLR